MLLGLPALAAYLAAIVTLLAYQLKHLREADNITLIAGGVTAGYLISSCFGITIFYTTPFFFFFLGLAARGPSMVETIREDKLAKNGSVFIDQPADSLTVESVEDTASVSLESTLNSKSTSTSRRRILLSAAICFLAATVVLPMEASLYAESVREQMDAETFLLLDNLLNNVKDINGPDMMWFDAASLSLISAENPAPQPYGRGTIVNGKTFLGTELSRIRYNLEEDYRSCVLLVNVVREDETVTFTQTWVRPNELLVGE